ncbi:MAG: dTDP-4-dehydrorhamnose 3,5-epimerase [Planctomycetota bacterium]
MQIIPTDIPAVKLIRPKRFGDHRGYFAETYSLPKLVEAGIDLTFVQDNESLSAEVGTVRGLHFQSPPFAQDKLVRCVQGSLLDVAVDIRRGSPTFGKHVSAVLSAENGDQLLVPKGFAHGFATLLPDTMVMYKVTDVYSPECDAGLLWKDPALGIDWQTAEEAAVLSDKDVKLSTLAELDSPFVYDPATDGIASDTAPGKVETNA